MSSSVSDSRGFAELDRSNWARGAYLDHYASRELRPAEAMILLRYRDHLGGRVLEVGCGAGRLLGYLAELSGQASGIDFSPTMLAYTEAHYPGVEVRPGDMADPDSYGPGPYDVIWISYCLIDELSDSDRRRVLGATRERLAPDGRLIFSSSNLDWIPVRDRRSTNLRAGLRRAARISPASAVRGAQAARRRRRNRAALAGLEERHEDYAILVVGAHDDSLLHYHIRRDDQERQLTELGFELIACLALDGEAVGPGELSVSDELHYIARPSPQLP